MFAKVYLEITNVCNLACPFCVKTTREKRFLSVDKFVTLAEKLRPHTDFLYFHLMGEPLLHPDIGTFLELAGQLGFRVILTTNGTRLASVGELLLHAPALFKVSLSLHAYEANPVLWETRYLEDCFDFADRSSARGIITVFRLWNDGGENRLNRRIEQQLRARFPNGEWVPNTKGTRIRKKLFIENGERFTWPMQSDAQNRNVRCYGLKDQIGVLCDGSVVPCCMDYDGNQVFGNLFLQDLDEILAGERVRCFRDALDHANAPCELCSHCGFAIQKFGAASNP